MASKNLTTVQQQALADALAAVAAAEEALERVRRLGIGGCDCDGPIPVGKYRCRTTDEGTISCQRCIGDNKWYDNGFPCESGPLCGPCSG